MLTNSLLSGERTPPSIRSLRVASHSLQLLPSWSRMNHKRSHVTSLSLSSSLPSHQLQKDRQRSLQASGLQRNHVLPLVTHLMSLLKPRKLVSSVIERSHYASVVRSDYCRFFAVSTVLLCSCYAHCTP